MNNTNITVVRSHQVRVARKTTYTETSTLTISVKRIIVGVMAGSFLLAIGLMASCFNG